MSDAKELDLILPEFDWRKVDREKNGCQYFYIFEYDECLSGIVYCYPDCVVEDDGSRFVSSGDVSKFTGRDDVIGKWNVELKIRKDKGGMNSYDYIDSLGKKNGKNEVAKAVKSAILSYTTVILKLASDDKRDEYKKLFKKLRNREVSV